MTNNLLIKHLFAMGTLEQMAGSARKYQAFTDRIQYLAEKNGYGTNWETYPVHGDVLILEENVTKPSTKQATDMSRFIRNVAHQIADELGVPIKAIYKRKVVLPSEAVWGPRLKQAVLKLLI